MPEGRASRRTSRTIAAAAAVGLLASGLAAGAGAGPATAAPADKPAKPDIRPIGGDYNNGKPLPFSKEGAGGSGIKSDEFKVGTVRKWPAIDDAQGTNYLKQFVLRGVGKNVEVWVAKDTAFPAGDCRNAVGGGEGIVVTDAQVASFVKEFDENIYPTESKIFSVPPKRDGSSTSLTNLYAKYYGLPSASFKGDGDKIVTLVDNVRDSNYYTPTAPDGKTYIAGFHYSLFNEYTNRNIMTLDAWDWTHRTGDGGEDNSADADYVACSNYLGRPFGDPRPLTYEGTFAHEYQHLLEYYESPGESNFVNEGLSDWAQTLVGYVDPSLDPANPDADGHLQTWMGFADDPAFGGPEQSLTRWSDQGAPEILADYGMAYAFMEYLHSHYGDAFMTALHRENKNGFTGLQAVMTQFNVTGTPLDVIHAFLASMAVDQQLEGSKALVSGERTALSTKTMSARINWDTAQAYSTSGAPTNGADWIKVAGGDGQYTFDGAEGYPAQPVQWTTATDGRLYSGTGDNLDRAIAHKVTIPATASASLTVDLQYDTEAAWDFVFVQVYDTAAKKWVSLSNGSTTSTNVDPQASATIRAQLPGFTGASTGIVPQTFDVSSYAGQEVYVAVRYMTDSSISGGGAWVSGLSVNGTPVPGATDLSTWTSLTGAVPVPVSGWTVQLVGWDGSNVSAVTLPLGAGSTWSGDVSDTLGIAAPEFAGFIVTADDPTLAVSQYADYSLAAGAATAGTTSTDASTSTKGKRG